MAEITIAHIINPYRARNGSDPLHAQAVTMATMKAAQAAASHEVEVGLFAAFFPEDEAEVPVGFGKARPLERSVLDMASITAGNPRKLPLLKDVLDRLHDVSSAGFLVYSNADIALMPGFYSRVKHIIEEGFTGFAINRRTIGDQFLGVQDIPRMIEAAEQGGEKHPGFDCFVFERQAYEKYDLGTSCIGGNWIGRVLLCNVMARAARFKIFEDERLTFHIGDDRPWLDAAHAPYNQHNQAQLTDILNRLTNAEHIDNRAEIVELRDSFQKACQFQPAAIPPNIIEMNSPVLELPGPPEKIYHARFRPNCSWEGWRSPLLRQDPVFIVGYPRSGTTPVQSLIATQENIYSFYETHFFSSVLPGVLENDGRVLPECLDAVIGKMRERIAFSRNAEAHVRSLALEGSLSSKMLFENLVIDNLIGKVGPERLPRIRWMEKTPLHAQHLPTIHRYYPAAKIIHVLRHPEKAIISRRRHFAFNNETEWTVEKHAQKWLECVAAVENFSASHPQSVLAVRLEDVARRPAAEMKRICRFLGIPFDRGLLEKHKAISASLHYPWETWKHGSMNEISRAVAERMSYSLPQPDREMLWTVAGEEMSRYGYHCPGMARERVSASAARTISLAGKHALRLGNSLGFWMRPRSGKINLADEARQFYGQHRYGWRYAVESLRRFHHPRGVRLDAFIERTFAWRSAELKPHLEPWIGFIHIPPNIPDWFQGYQSNDKIFQSEAWKRSAPFCKGLYTLSDYHRRHLLAKTDIPVNSLLFPTDFRVTKWSWERFLANRDKKIIQVGWWLRRIHSIFMLPTSKYRKIFLKVNYFDWEELIQKERELLRQAGEFRFEMMLTAETRTFLPDHEYDRLLSANLVFLHLYDSSANNTIIECIARHTPVLVNPLEAVVEYLGPDYPFYFISLEEAAQKAADLDLVLKTHRYLAGFPFKEKLTGEHFCASFKESEIYRAL